MQQFLRDTVGPRIMQRSQDDMKEALAEIDQLFAAFDAAHSSVRDVEQSTAVMSDLRSGLIVWMEHSSAGSSAVGVKSAWSALYCCEDRKRAK